MRILLVYLLLAFGSFGQSFNNGLIGLANQKLIKIDKSSGQIENYINITGYPSADPTRLAWVEPLNCYFTIHISNGAAVSLARISADGVYTVLGNVVVPGQTVYLLESVAYNYASNELYITGSLNGGPSNNDFCSETLMKINPATLTASVVGTFQHSVSGTSALEAEGDIIDFDLAGNFYYLDAVPGSFLRIYTQPSNLSGAPQQIHSQSYEPVYDMSIRDGSIYYGNMQSLSRLNLSNNQFTAIGNMFPASIFSGQNMRGITWRTLCDPIDVLPETVMACEGENALLDATYGTGWSYLWSNGSTSPDISVSTPGQYTVTITKNDCILNETVNVTFNSSLTISGGQDQTICEGNDAVLSGSGAVSYTWNHNVQNGISFTPQATQTYTVTGTDGNGCSGTDEVTITVIAVPELLHSEDVTLCVGDNSSIGVSQLAGWTYSWNNGATSAEVNVADPGTYTLTASNGSCSVSYAVEVAIAEPPQIEAGPDWAVCPGEAVLLSGYGGVSYTWTNGAQDGVSFAPFQSGIYTVTGVDGNGCSSTDFLTVTFLQEPVADFVILSQGEAQAGCVIFENTSQNATSFWFDFGNGTSTDEFNIGDSVSGCYSETGTYIVRLTAYNSTCSDVKTINFLNESRSNYYVPNAFTPDGDEFNNVFGPVFAQGIIPEEYRLVIYNRWGELIFETLDVRFGWNGTYAGSLVQDNIYVWEMRLKMSDSSDVTETTGHVTIIR